MESRPSYKSKNKVLTSHRRRISSILNQSPTKLNASKGDIKRKISVLVKNNRTLAIALEDAQCELSSKQKLLEKASEYFQTIMLARVKMIQMWTSLNTVLKDFDGTLKMLQSDNFTLSDITPPFQSSGKLKKKMKKIAEAVGSVNEESSFLSLQESEGSDSGSSADPPISRNRLPSDFCPVPTRAVENKADETSPNSEPVVHQSSAKNCIPDSSILESVRPGSPGEKSEVDLGNKEEMMPIPDDPLIPGNDTGTPKLSLPTEILVIDFKKCTRPAFSLVNEKDSSLVKKFSNSLVKKPEVLSKPGSSQKILNSKIPRLHSARNMAIKESCLSDEFNKEKSVCPKNFSKESVSIPKEMNEIDCRRKTFVVKNSDLETVVALNEREADMSDLEDELNSETFSNRKTFVVKSSSALKKKRKSVNNKRKTFVKKANKINSPKSTTNRRGTFVVTDIGENCEEDQPLTNLINSECDNLVQDESNKPCVVTVSEALPPYSNDLCEITQNLQLPQKNFFISDNPEVKNQQSNSTELFPKTNFEETLEKKCKTGGDKRKTFVKKSDKINSCKSFKNKRGTFVLTHINENCVEENQPLKDLINSECDDLIKEKLDVPCVVIDSEALPSNDSCETTKTLQLLESNCIITDKPETMKTESNSKELLPEVCPEGTLKKNLEDTSEIKDVNKLVHNKKKDTRVVKFDEKVIDIQNLKSTVLLQNPPVELPVLPDRTTNETGKSTSEAKSSKEEKNNCTADSMECNNGNLLLKNSNRRKTCVTVAQEKDMSKIRAPEKEPAVLQTFPQELPVHFSKEESQKEPDSKQSEPEMKINDNEKGGSSLKSIQTDKNCKTGVKHAIEGIEKDETNFEYIDLISDGEVAVLNNDKNKRKSRSRKKISYKMFIEPSFSDCESISEVENLDAFEDEINSFALAKVPVRGKVSFSNKKNYVFHRNADAKIKPQKPLAKSKNFTDELVSASSLNRNCEDSNLKTDINQMSEDVGTNNLVHLANPKGKKTDLKCQVTFSDAQETIPNAVKSTESNRTNIDNIKMQKNSKPEVLFVQNHKNVNKTELPSNYSPVISLDKCLNAIELDMGDKKKKSDKMNVLSETKPKIQSIEANDDNNTTKQTDSASGKTSKKKGQKQNRPKKKKKEAIESDAGKENVQNSHVSNKEGGNSNIQNNKAKNSKEKKLTKNNAMVVEAEIHPPPRTFNQLDTNTGNTLNYEVAVVLNDIFQSKKTGLLSVNNKENRDKNYVMGSPFSSNSRNMQAQAANKSEAAKEGENEDLAECRRSKRTRVMNYAEPSLNKKLRR